MYYSQCLEQQVSLMLSSMYNDDFAQASYDERDRFFDENIKKTLGKLAKDLRERTHLSVDLEEKLREAVELRNWLAHRYFAERDRDILTEEGKEKMITELQDCADFFSSLDTELSESLKAWMHSNGVSEEKIQEEMRSYLLGSESK